MAFEEWMNDSGWEPSEAGEAALEDAWQAAHAEGVAEGRAAERERCLTICREEAVGFQETDWPMESIERVISAIKEAADDTR